MKYQINNKYFDFDSQTFVMGILNITPDSFYDSGKYFSKDSAVEFAYQIVSEGADILDVGGESTRPNSERISYQEEMDRVVPVLETLFKSGFPIPISIDTYKPDIAEETCKIGVSIINDISGITHDDSIVDIAKKYDAALIINHINGTIETMHAIDENKNIIDEILLFFEEKISLCKSKNFTKIILDPGIGFGKTLFQNLEILKNIHVLRQLNFPVLIALSRKRFIGELLNNSSCDRLAGTLAANAVSIYNGANIIRVHDVKENVDVLKISESISKSYKFISSNVH
jgi:dihydropteroate synthase